MTGLDDVLPERPTNLPLPADPEPATPVELPDAVTRPPVAGDVDEREDTTWRSR